MTIWRIKLKIEANRGTNQSTLKNGKKEKQKKIKEKRRSSKSIEPKHDKLELKTQRASKSPPRLRVLRVPKSHEIVRF